MGEHARTTTLLAVLVAVAVALASLMHTHDHTLSQGRASQACVFCSHAINTAPGVAPISPPLPMAQEAARPEPRLVSLEVVISHPGRGPPTTSS
jgi:hypothetical protein